MIESAGIVLFRKAAGETQVLLVHMGGPIWAKRDEKAWSIPKGAISRSEYPLQAAKREFLEEVGSEVTGECAFLGTFRQNSGKKLTVWYAEGELDPAAMKSNSFSMVWPPRSGQVQSFPEADRACWFSRDCALRKIVAGQRKVLEAFFTTMPR